MEADEAKSNAIVDKAQVEKTSSLLPVSTSTGIPLDIEWKKLEYKYAQEHVVHPSWGLAHAERDYRNAVMLAEREKMIVDKDVLFAAAYLHDLGGIGSFQKEHVDHAVRSVELAEPLLRGWGFPMSKWASVKETILGHVYYGAAPTLPEAIVFHDADCLDFLGDIGIARLYAASSELSKGEANLADSTKAIVSLQKQIPEKLITNAAKADSLVRVAETNEFLNKLSLYNYDAKAF